MTCDAIGLLVVVHVRMAVGARAIRLFVINVKPRMAKFRVLPIARIFMAGITRARIMIRRFATGVTR